MGCAARHATITDGVNYGLGLIEANNHVMDDMHPGGAFMGTLNDSASLATESDSIQTRQAIIVTTSDWYYMGVSRLVLSNGAADDLTTVVYGAAYTAWAVSWDMFNNAKSR